VGKFAKIGYFLIKQALVSIWKKKLVVHGYEIIDRESRSPSFNSKVTMDPLHYF